MLELSNKLHKVKRSFMNNFSCVIANNYVTPSSYSTKYKQTRTQGGFRDFRKPPLEKWKLIIHKLR